MNGKLIELVGETQAEITSSTHSQYFAQVVKHCLHQVQFQHILQHCVQCLRTLLCLGPGKLLDNRLADKLASV